MGTKIVKKKLLTKKACANWKFTPFLNTHKKNMLLLPARVKPAQSNLNWIFWCVFSTKWNFANVRVIWIWERKQFFLQHFGEFCDVVTFFSKYFIYVKLFMTAVNIDSLIQIITFWLNIYSFITFSMIQITLLPNSSQKQNT